MENWEKEFEELLDGFLETYKEGRWEDEQDAGVVKLKNFIQKQKLIAKLNENQAWYAQSNYTGNTELSAMFQAMIIKYESILSRF